MAAYDHMRRSSLYVGDLHPEVTEKDLTETFARVGPLLSVHLCRDKFSGNSLCYAYVNFWLPCHAFAALKYLNHSMLRGKSMRIMSYERDPAARKNGIGNLFVKNLNQSITSARLQTIFSEYGTILSCKVAEEKGISKGFGFVQFDSDDSAMAAIDALHDTELEGKQLYVAKFQRKSERKGAELGLRSNRFSELSDGSTNQFIESKGSKLFVKNLDASVDDKKLEDLFSTYGKVTSAKVIRAGGVSRGFGFVCLSSPEDAKKALISASGANFEGRTLYVAVAWPKKPETRNLSKSSENSPPQPHYTSNYYPHLSSSIPSAQPIPLYRHFFIPSNSSNLVQAQNFKSSFYPLPMNPAALTAYGLGKHLEMSKGQLLQEDRKELCKGLGTTKTLRLGSSPETNKIRPEFMLQKIQVLQTGKLNGQQRYLEMWKGQTKLINGEGIHGIESCNGSDSLGTQNSPQIPSAP